MCIMGKKVSQRLLIFSEECKAHNKVYIQNRSTIVTRLYANLDIPESRKLIDVRHGEESVPKIIDIFRRMQGT
jgi:hypothetical protein